MSSGAWLVAGFAVGWVLSTLLLIVFTLRKISHDLEGLARFVGARLR